jgi:hypothetical protein
VYLFVKVVFRVLVLRLLLDRAMLHTVLSTVNKDSADVLQRVIRETGHFVLDRVFSPYPSPYEMSRALSTLRLDVVFLDVTYSGPASSLVEQIRSTDPSLPVIGFSTQASHPVPPPDLAAFMELPLSAHKLSKTTREAIRGRGHSNYSNVTAILPAKAGGGATPAAARPPLRPTPLPTWRNRSAKESWWLNAIYSPARSVSASDRVRFARFQKQWSRPTSLRR